MCVLDIQENADRHLSLDQRNSGPDEKGNPFMTLVYAATSILDKNATSEKDCTGLTSDSLEASSNDLDESNDAENMEDSSACCGEPPVLFRTRGSCTSIGAQEMTSPSASKDQSKRQSFAEHLMAILEDEKNSSVIAWMPDGKAFTIVNPKRFTTSLMPKLFNIRNMSSFVRKLGRWGFHRAHEKATKNSDIFKHKEFRKGHWDLCSKIKCMGRQSVVAIASRTETHKRFQTPIIKDTSPKPVNTLDVRPQVFIHEQETIGSLNTVATAWRGSKVHGATSMRILKQGHHQKSGQTHQFQKVESQVLQKHKQDLLQFLLTSALSHRSPINVTAPELLNAAIESIGVSEEPEIPDFQKDTNVFSKYQRNSPYTRPSIQHHQGRGRADGVCHEQPPTWMISTMSSKQKQSKFSRAHGIRKYVECCTPMYG